MTRSFSSRLPARARTPSPHVCLRRLAAWLSDPGKSSHEHRLRRLRAIRSPCSPAFSAPHRHSKPIASTVPKRLPSSRCIKNAPAIGHSFIPEVLWRRSVSDTALRLIVPDSMIAGSAQTAPQRRSLAPWLARQAILQKPAGVPWDARPEDTLVALAHFISRNGAILFIELEHRNLFGG